MKGGSISLAHCDLFRLLGYSLHLLQVLFDVFRPHQCDIPSLSFQDDIWHCVNSIASLLPNQCLGGLQILRFGIDECFGVRLIDFSVPCSGKKRIEGSRVPFFFEILSE